MAHVSTMWWDGISDTSGLWLVNIDKQRMVDPHINVYLYIYIIYWIHIIYVDFIDVFIDVCPHPLKPSMFNCWKRPDQRGVSLIRSVTPLFGTPPSYVCSWDLAIPWKMSVCSSKVVKKLDKSWKTNILTSSGWWFQTCVNFHNTWSNPSHWLILFNG